MKKKVLLIILISQFLILNSFAQTTATIRLDSASGQNCFVNSYYPNLNFNPDLDLCAGRWTSSIAFTDRSYFRFNLTAIPSNATIVDARLTLYGNPSPQHMPGHSTYGGPNPCYIRKVVSTWDEHTMTWSTQPSVTVANQVSLPASNSSMQDYPNIDITTLIRDMIINPATNFGFVLQLQDEVTLYRSMDFASGDCPDSTKRPKLVITYIPVGIQPLGNEVPENFRLNQNYPNPFNPTTKITFDLPSSPRSPRESGERGVGGFVTLFIYDLLGREIARLVNESLKPGRYETQWKATNIPSGTYFYRLTLGNFIDTKKMILIR